MNLIEQTINKSESERLDQGILSVGGRGIGILVPSLVWSKDSKGHLSFVGKEKMVSGVHQTSAQILKALTSIDAILFGSEHEINHSIKILRSPLTSRTASFILLSCRNCFEFLHTMSQIERGSILIVGCGGIGSLVALNLAGSGVGKLHLADPDHIEESNLNRQFFWRRNDIGKSKVEILKREIQDRYPNVLCTTQTTALTDKKINAMANTYTDIVVTADEPLGIGQFIDKENGDKIISSGYFHTTLRVEIGIKEGAQKIGPQWFRGPNFIGPSFGPSNTEIAGILSSYVTQRLSGLIPRKTNHFYMEWNSTKFPRTHDQ